MKSHRAFVIIASHVIQRTDFDDSSVVDQDIDPVEMIDDFPNGRLNLIAIEQIAFDCENISATGGEIGLSPGKLFRITREKGNLPSLVANMSRQHETKTARSATDEGDFVAQAVLRRANDTSGYPTTE
jgi:hypothetical protein